MQDARSKDAPDTNARPLHNLSTEPRSSIKPSHSHERSKDKLSGTAEEDAKNGSAHQNVTAPTLHPMYRPVSNERDRSNAEIGTAARYTPSNTVNNGTDTSQPVPMPQTRSQFNREMRMRIGANDRCAANDKATSPIDGGRNYPSHRSLSDLLRALG